MDLTVHPFWPPEYVALAGVLLAVLALGAAARSTAHLPTAMRATIGGLRLAAVLGVVMVALNPGRWVRPDRAEAPEWRVLLDASRSMAQEDVDGRTRFDAAQEFADSLSDRAPDGVAVRISSFADALAPDAKDVQRDEIPDGSGSNLVGALRETVEDFSARPGRLDRVLIASDGIQTPPAKPDRAIRKALAMGVPVDTLCLGGAVPPKDLAVRAEGVGRLAFAGQPLSLVVNVRADGLGRISPTIVLEDGEGTAIQTKQCRLEDGRRQSVALELLAPPTPGFYSYTVRTDPEPGERQTSNNAAAISLVVLDSAIRTLLVEGVPHWDSKFLVHLLRNHESFQLTELYRLGQDRFYCIGEDGERADEAAFPDTMAKLTQYDAVILGKSADLVLGSAGADLLHNYVREQGGVVLFARSRPWSDNAEDKMTAMDPVVWGGQRTARAAWRPLQAGVDAGLFGEQLPAPESPVWHSLPPVRKVSEVERVRSFTTVLAESVDGNRTAPLLVSRRYGSGVVLALNAEGLWHWDFFPTSRDSREVYRSFWPLLVQWALTHAEFPPGMDMVVRLAQNPVQVGEPVDFSVRARNSETAPTGPIRVALAGDDGRLRTIQLQPSLSERGRWDGLLSPDSPGTHRIEIPEQRAAPAALEVLPSPDEDTRLSADPDFLTRLSEATDGRRLRADAPENWRPPEADNPARADLGPPLWEASWDRPLWLLLIVLPLAMEWFLRRRNMLA